PGCAQSPQWYYLCHVADAGYPAVWQYHGNADPWSVHPEYTEFDQYRVWPVHAPVSPAVLHHQTAWSQTDPDGYSPDQPDAMFPDDDELPESHRRNAWHLQRSSAIHQKYSCPYSLLPAFHGYNVYHDRHRKAHTYLAGNASLP